MKFGYKIRAGALQFVLFVGAVIAVLLLTFVLLNYSHLLFLKKTDKFIDTVKRPDMALLHHLQDNPQPLETVLEDGIVTEISQGYWGVFGMAKVTAVFQKNHFTKMALTGSGLYDPDVALFLRENDRPMIITGSAQIRGNAQLPQQGIRPGTIAGQSFYGNSLIIGEQLLSNRRLPELAAASRTAIRELFSGNSSFTGLQSGNFTRNELVHSFSEPTLWLDGDRLDLSGKKLVGNIIIKGSYRLVVENTTQLQDVILVAPEIVVQDGVRGTFQAFATEHIAIGRNCALNYPSALLLLDQKKTDPSGRNTFGIAPEIDISTNTSIKGVVCYLTKDNTQQFHPQIKIDERSFLIGQVYCERNLELKGTVLGHVATHSFIALENGNVYQNHLYNGVIDVTQLPFQYKGLPYGTGTKNGVVKWLY